jgi:anaerobic dimethyl sulfoxide reductase subunit B (iron-sulfur subunit)
MRKPIGLVANLQLCIGCFACEVACKEEHNLPEGKNGIKVRTLGPYELNGNLAMDFVPLATEECDLCAERAIRGKRPFCAQICPTQALELHSDEEILNLLRKKDRYHICKLKG